MKRILILNRRDIKNPLSGGAEIYTHEIFKRLADQFEITHFSSHFKGGLREEAIDNIRYRRQGDELTAHFCGFVHALRNNGLYDFIVDEFNGLGFMTFGFKQSLVLIHQLYDDFWTAKLGRIGIFFKFLEKALLKLYRNKIVITVSNSTKEDISKLGFDLEKIFLVYNGIDYVPCRPKEGFKRVVMYLGRLVKTKNPEDAIRAFLIAKKKLPDLKLLVAGDGDQRQYLENKYSRGFDVEFLGYVSEKQKKELLREASVLLVPSIREGWGQVVIQANMVGTPAVGYDVEGLRDSVLDGETGFLVPKGRINEFAFKIIYLFKNLDVMKRVSVSALQYSKKFSWDKSAEQMKSVIEKSIMMA